MPWTERGDRRRSDPGLPRFRSRGAGGRAPVSGPAASFFASLESYEPSRSPASRPSARRRAPIAPRASFIRRPAGSTARGGRGGVAGRQRGGRALTAIHGTTLSHIPGHVEAGQSVNVSGTLEQGLGNPRLYITRPSGEVEEMKLGGSAPRSRRGSCSGNAANTPSRCSPTALEALKWLPSGGFSPESSRPPDRPRGACARGSRRRRGGHCEVARVARIAPAGSRPRPRRGGRSTQPGDGAHANVRARASERWILGDRLRARGYAYRSIGENIGLSSDVGTAHDAIAGSPAHLANLLDPRHRRLGLGAASGLTADGAEGVYLTEVFAVPIVGIPDPVAEVHASSRRSGRGGVCLHCSAIRRWMASLARKSASRQRRIR